MFATSGSAANSSTLNPGGTLNELIAVNASSLAGITFRGPGGVIEWRTHVFSARTEELELDPIDTHEIKAARWGSAAELAGPIRARLLETARALWRYRVALHDAALAAL